MNIIGGTIIDMGFSLNWETFSKSKKKIIKLQKNDIKTIPCIEGGESNFLRNKDHIVFQKAFLIKKAWKMANNLTTAQECSYDRKNIKAKK